MNKNLPTKSNLINYSLSDLTSEISRVNEKCESIFDSVIVEMQEFKQIKDEEDKLKMKKIYDNVNRWIKEYNDVRTPLTKIFTTAQKLYTTDEAQLKEMLQQIKDELNNYENMLLQKKLEEERKLREIAEKNSEKIGISSHYKSYIFDYANRLISECKKKMHYIYNSITLENQKTKDLQNFDININFDILAIKRDYIKILPKYKYFHEAQVFEILKQTDAEQLIKQTIQEQEDEVKAERQSIIDKIPSLIDFLKKQKSAKDEAEKQRLEQLKIAERKAEEERLKQIEIEKSLESEKNIQRENDLLMFDAMFSSVSEIAEPEKIGYELPEMLSKRDFIEIISFWLNNQEFDADKLKNKFKSEINYCLRNAELFMQTSNLKLVKIGKFK